MINLREAFNLFYFILGFRGERINCRCPRGWGIGLQLESQPGTRKASLVLYIHNLFANSASSSSGPAGIIGWVFLDKLMIDVCISVQSMVGKV